MELLVNRDPTIPFKPACEVLGLPRSTARRLQAPRMRSVSTGLRHGPIAIYEQTACTSAPVWTTPGSTTAGGGDGNAVLLAPCRLVAVARRSAAVWFAAPGSMGLMATFEGGIGHVESELAGGSEPGDAPEEHVCGREQSEPRVTVLIRVPLEELGEPAASVRCVPEAARVIGLVLHGLEAGLGEWVVVGDARPTDAALDAELGEQVDEGAGGHRRATIVVHRDGARRGLVARDGLGEELLREGAVLALCDHPGHGKAAEQVEHEAEVQEHARHVGGELRNIPRPNLIRRGGFEPRHGVRARLPLAATLAALAMSREDAVIVLGEPTYLPSSSSSA